MADREVDFLLIGGGLASASCAQELRAQGAQGSILVVGREPDPPYDRPPLSKGYLRGQDGREDGLVHESGWWDEHDVELLTKTSVMKLDTDACTATLQSKEVVGYGKALLATGSNVRRLRAPGGDLEGIHYLRAFGNSDAIREDCRDGGRVVLVGGSYVATEVAASLTSEFGCECTLVMPEGNPLELSFGEEIGAWFGDLLRSNGVRIESGAELERFEGADGRVGRVVTSTGVQLDCSAVVVGAGVMPDVMLARAAGLELGDTGGVRCSARLETSAAGVFAAGDVCEYESAMHGGPIRVEHWDVAFQHGKTAASNMLGRGIAHQQVPYFFSDIADWASLEYVGPGSGRAHIRGSLADGEFTAFYVDDARVTAALSIGRSDDLDHARRFISGRERPDPSALQDLDCDLAGL